VLLVHRWLGAGRAAVGFLVLASFFWYSVWDWRFGPLILLSLTVNWWGARRLERTKQRWFYVALLLFNLTPLLYFKYTRFFFSVAGTQPDDWLRPEFIPHLLPLGISFFTFQKLAYVTDIYRGKPAEQSWLKFSFFVLFFPQLVAGPITHHSQILPQLRKEPKDREALFFAGCIYFLVGFVKKCFGADLIATEIDPYFVSGAVGYADQSIVATLGYTLQLYFDFSGYSDMAVGLAALFGFRLPWNFNSPYKATSFSDFWQRWHITLSAFLREYLYIHTLGGNRVAPWRRYFNLFATMVIGGFWHGAGWAFIVWGAGHGVLLCLQHLLGAKRWSRIPSFIQRPLVFLSIALLWIPFRTENLNLTGEILHGFMSWRPLAWQPIYLYGLAGLAVVWFAPNSHAIASLCTPRLNAVAHYTWALGGRVGWYALAGLLVTSAAITSFYRDAPDVWLRRHLPMACESDFVRNDAGDLRTNINRAAVLAAPGEKWVVAGPSYARNMGLFTWQDKQKTISVGSVGIGGQSFSHWVRIPLAVLQDPEVRRLYIACSPIGLFAPTPLGNEAVFATQGADALDLIGIRSPSRSHSSLFGEPVSFFQTGWDIATLQLRDPRYFQLQGTALTVVEHLRGGIVAPVPVPLNETDLLSAARTIEALKQQALVSPESPDDLSNGVNARFHWESRGLLEALSRDGGTDQALGRLNTLAKQNGVQIILYETPTLKNHPGIYPSQFYERYQLAINDLAKRHNVDYIDLSGLLPEDGNSMYDFCHPRSEHAPLILKTLISHTRHE
jgi:alginate O-acetyltransferase complex protein AlgI